MRDDISFIIIIIIIVIVVVVVVVVVVITFVKSCQNTTYIEINSSLYTALIHTTNLLQKSLLLLSTSCLR